MRGHLCSGGGSIWPPSTTQGMSGCVRHSKEIVRRKYALRTPERLSYLYRLWKLARLDRPFPQNLVKPLKPPIPRNHLIPLHK